MNSSREPQTASTPPTAPKAATLSRRRVFGLAGAGAAGAAVPGLLATPAVADASGSRRVVECLADIQGGQ